MGGLDTSRVTETQTGSTPTVDARTRLALEGQSRSAVTRTDNTGATFDPIAQAGAIHTASETIFHMKDAAEQSLPQGWAAASKNYDATVAQATQTAQSIDIPKALKAVDQLLATTTDEDQKRALLQEKLDLETMAKAPGFTLAVKGLAEKRLGMDADADRDLAQAKQLWAQLDPPLRMEDDPNYQRHLANCTAEEAQLRAGGGQVATGGAQDTRTGQGGDTRTGQAADTRATYTPTDSATIARLNLPNDWNRESAAQQINWLSSQTKPLDADMKALYESAIAKAQAGPSPALPAMQSEYTTLQQHIDQAEKTAHPDYDAQVTTILNGLQTQIGSLPQDKQQKAADYVRIYRTVSENTDDQKQVRDAIAKLDPTIGPQINASLDKLDALNQPVQAQIFDLHKRATAIGNEKNQLSYARANYAEALFNAHDTQNAQLQIVKAIGDNTDPQQAYALKLDAVKYGVPKDQVAQMPDVATTTQTAQTSPTADNLPAIATAIKAAQDGFAAETGDKASALAKHDAEFKAAAQQADAYMTAHVAQLTAAIDDSTKKIQAAMTPQEITQMQALAPQLTAEQQRVAQASPSDMALYQKYEDQNTTDTDRQAALATLTHNQPKLMQLDHDFNALYSKAPDAINTQIQSVALLQAATANRFVAHENYANALNAGGHPDLAVAQVREAFKDLPPNMRAAFAQDPKLKPLLDSLHFDMNTVPAPENQFFLRASQNVPQQAYSSDSVAGGPRPDAGSPQDGGIPNARVVQQLQQIEADKQRLQQLETQAQQTSDQKGLAAAKPLFEQAAKLADQLAGDPQQDRGMLATGLAKLNDTANPMSPADRQMTLSILRNTISLQQNAADLHRQMAEMYIKNNQWADAQREFGEADKRFGTIDNKLVGQFINTLDGESKRTDIDPALKAQYTDDLKAIRQGQENQISLHLKEAGFYLLGGRQPNGTPVNWDTATQKPVISGNPPLKPELARTALQTVANLDAQIHPNSANASDFVQSFQLLQATYNVNVPSSLQMDIQTVKSSYQKPITQIVAAGSGLAATFILAAVSEGRASRLAAAGDDAALATIRAGENGFVRRAADYFASSSKVAKISSAALLSPVGRFAVGATTAGTVNSLEQYYGVQNHEQGSAPSAFVEGAGAFTSAMALLGAKNYAGKVFFRGATGDAIGRQAIEMLGGSGTATTDALAARFKAKGYAVPAILNTPGELTPDIAAQIFGNRERSAMLLSKLFTNAELKTSATAIANEATTNGTPNPYTVRGNTWNPITSDLARRNMAVNYSALTAFSLVNTMTQSGSNALTGEASAADPWTAWNPFRPINNLDGTNRGTFKDYALQAMTAPWIGNAFFAELGSLPAAQNATNKIGTTFSETRAQAQAFKTAAAGSPEALAMANKNLVQRLWARSAIVRPAAAEVSNQVHRVGSYLNPPEDWGQLSVAQKWRQANYLPILANGGAFQFVPMAQAALPWGPIGGIRAEWERELSTENADIQNDALPAASAQQPEARPANADVGPPRQPVKVIATPGGSTSNGL